MKLSLFSGFYILVFFCIGCRKKEINIRTEPVIPTNQILLPDQFKLIKHQIADDELTKMIAFECLIPEHWIVEDRILWDSTDLENPFHHEGIFHDSIGKLNVRSYSDIRSNYTVGPRGFHGKKPPLNVLEGLKELIKRERSNKSYKIIDEKSLNVSKFEGENNVDKYVNEHAENGLIRIEFEEKNEKIVEEYYGKLEVSKLSSQGLFDLHTTKWSMGDLFSCKAPINKMELCRMLAMTIRTSKKPTIAFYNIYNQVIELSKLKGNQKSTLFEQVSKITQRVSDEVPQKIKEEYKNLQQAKDLNNTQFGIYVGGIELYKDENHVSVLLPAGYQKAWKNESGDCMMSLNSAYEPNVSENVNWKLLEKY